MIKFVKAIKPNVQFAEIPQGGTFFYNEYIWIKYSTNYSVCLQTGQSSSFTGDCYVRPVNVEAKVVD